MGWEGAGWCAAGRWVAALGGRAEATREGDGRLRGEDRRASVRSPVVCGGSKRGLLASRGGGSEFRTWGDLDSVEFRTYDACKLALYHNLGHLPQPPTPTNSADEPRLLAGHVPEASQASPVTQAKTATP